MVWTCLPFIRSGQNHLAWHSERGKKKGRQRKRWEDSIREWTGQELAKSRRAVENREKWRELVVKSPVVSQRPPWLRDRRRRRDTTHSAWMQKSTYPLLRIQNDQRFFSFTASVRRKSETELTANVLKKKNPKHARD